MEQNKEERLVDYEILGDTLMHGALGAIKYSTAWKLRQKMEIRLTAT